MRNYSVGLAMGTVGFRVIESVGDILGGISTIALLALSQEFVKAGFAYRPARNGFCRLADRQRGLLDFHLANQP